MQGRLIPMGRSSFFTRAKSTPRASGLPKTGCVVVFRGPVPLRLEESCMRWS
jgi:hypothetical protein